MDIHEVEEEHLQTLVRQKQILQGARKRQGQRPQDWKPREEVYMSFMMAIMAQDLHKEGKHMTLMSFVPPSYLPCNASLAELRPIHIRDLQLETHHRGTYLMVRAITPPNRMTAIMVLVEDERGHVVMLQIYQQDDETTRAATEIVNVGKVMILKEPFLKVMGSGEYGLRIDHLSDVVEVDEHDPRRPVQWRLRVLDTERSVESLKGKGNEAVKAENYHLAIAQ